MEGTDKKRILVIEDEKKIVQLIGYNLKKAGYEVDYALDGEEGLMKAIQGNYDLILLDIMLPKMDGFEICERLRIKSDVPIIFTTAKVEDQDKINGLDIGADDYMTKPYSPGELIARINARLRRSTQGGVAAKKEKLSQIVIGDIVIDSDKYSVTKKGDELSLSKIEYNLLVFLAENAGQAYKREELLEEVWKYEDFYGDTRNVDVTVNRLRQKIEKDPAKPEYLMTKRGVGYYIRKI